MPVSIYKESTSDITVINPNITPVFKPVHGASKGTAQQNLSKILNEAQAGDIFGGDFNVNFLDLDTVQVLATILDEKGLKIDLSDDSVSALKVWFKIRSATSLYSQQPLKNGTPDIFLKDLSFKLITKTANEPSIPDALKDKLTELSGVRQQVIRELALLKKKNQLDELSIKALCSNLGVVNFHNLEESFGHDHPSTYYYDEESNTLCYSINSIQHAAYDFENHFKDGEDLDLKDIMRLYSELDRRVFIEMYTLLATRDQTDVLTTDNQSNEDLKALVAAQLQESNTSSNKRGSVTLTKEQIAEYFANILYSDELSHINETLKSPYPLTDESFITQRINTLVSEKYLESYSTTISAIINAPYQALDTHRPTQEQQSISLSGNGFLPFTDERNQFIPIGQIEASQLKCIDNELTLLQTRYPTANVSVAVIEGKEQPTKCAAIRSQVNKINTENLAGKANCNDLLFYLTLGLSATTSLTCFAQWFVLTIESFMTQPDDDTTLTMASRCTLFGIGTITGLASIGLFHGRKNPRAQENPPEKMDQLQPE